MKLTLKTAMISLAAFLMSRTAANAHAHLVSTKLITDAAEHSEIDLSFSEALSLQFSGAKIVTVDGKQVNLGPLALLKDDAKVLIIPVQNKLTVGTYFVDWKAVADDGHKTTGRASFEVKP